MSRMGSRGCVRGFCPRRYPLTSDLLGPLEAACPFIPIRCLQCVDVPKPPQEAKPEAVDTSGDPQEQDGPDDGEEELEELDSIDDPDGVLGDLMKRLQTVRARAHQRRTYCPPSFNPRTRSLIFQARSLRG